MPNYFNLTDFLKKKQYVADLKKIDTMKHTFIRGLPPAMLYAPRVKPPIAADYNIQKLIFSEIVGSLYALAEIKEPVKLETQLARKVHEEYASQQVSEIICLLERSLQFSILNQGNCSHRAAFAAIYLVDALDSSVKIRYHSFPEKDQFVLILTTPEKECFIYDPLTNPDLLFKQTYYHQKVLPSFSNASHLFRQLSLVVTPQMAKTFYALLGRVSTSMHSCYINANINKTRFVATINNMKEIDYLMHLFQMGLFSRPDICKYLPSDVSGKQELIQRGLNYLDDRLSLAANPLADIYLDEGLIPVENKSSFVELLEEKSGLEFYMNRNEEYFANALTLIKTDAQEAQAKSLQCTIQAGGFFTSLQKQKLFIINNVNDEECYAPIASILLQK